MLNGINKEIKRLSKPERAKSNAWFFKTGKGQYGEGDRFIGLTLPDCHYISKKYMGLGFAEIGKLLKSPYHEHRLVGLLILVKKFRKSKIDREKKVIVDFYLKNLKAVDNWDLVDLTAPRILGAWLFEKGTKEKKILYKMAKSENLWERRIAIISTSYFIYYGQHSDALNISKILLHDKHDLIHKAVGWMLREIGKRDTRVLENFLNKYSKTMPRTMLRYSIEKFPESKRKKYMAR